MTDGKPFPCLDICNYVSYSTLRCFLSLFKCMAVLNCFIVFANISVRETGTATWLGVPVTVQSELPLGVYANPASCTMGTGSFPGVKSGRGVTLTPHPLLVPLVMKE